MQMFPFPILLRHQCYWKKHVPHTNQEKNKSQGINMSHISKVSRSCRDLKNYAQIYNMVSVYFLAQCFSKRLIIFKTDQKKREK